MAWTTNCANSWHTFFSSYDKREDQLVCEEQLVEKGLEEMWNDAQKWEGWTDGGSIWNFSTTVQSLLVIDTQMLKSLSGCSFCFLVIANLLHWIKSCSLRCCPLGAKKLLSLRTLTWLQWNVPVPIAVWSVLVLLKPFDSRLGHLLPQHVSNCGSPSQARQSSCIVKLQRKDSVALFPMSFKGGKVLYSSVRCLTTFSFPWACLCFSLLLNLLLFSPSLEKPKTCVW